jgi:DegV family protein with EDD domain
MKKIAIVTDSSAYLSEEFIGKNNIHVIPLRIHWDEETFLDGVDINPAQFYDRLEKSATVPTTSQPSAGDFVELFKKLSAQYDSIIAILISSGISGTVQSAEIALKTFSEIPVEIVDSHSTSAGLGMIVNTVAQAVSKGKTLQEIKLIADGIVKQLKLFFVVDTLEYLHKGGRIGGASRFLGTTLSIKPILCFDENGKLDGLERVRTKRKALTRLIELTIENTGDKQAEISLIHANAQKEAEQFRNEVQGYFPGNQIDIYELSPVIGTHVGPGTIGIASYTV